MARKILFRGKRLDNGEWVEGGYYKEDYTDKIYITFWNSFGLGFMDATQVDPDTVGEYTGLLDKNGKPIFEGDIISIHIESDDEVYDEVSYIDWLNCGWYYCQKGTLDSELEAYQSDSRMLTVIGNIHDNPELLEGENDNA
jgi:uncharacterized phage protein (TIGR01671 family)